jgi:hypothetical protein
VEKGFFVAVTFLPNISKEKKDFIRIFHAIAEDEMCGLEEKIGQIQSRIGEIVSRNPNLTKYIYQERTLTAEGIRFVLQKKNPTSHPWVKNIRVCEYREDFEKEILSIQKEENFYKSFIVGALSKDPRCLCLFYHFTHICIERKREKICVFVTDSEIVEDMQEYVSTIKEKYFPSAEIFFLEINRQFDYVSCSVFALRDAVLFMKHREKCRDFLRVCFLPARGSLTYYSYLPHPSLMVCEQSFRVLETYLLQASSVYPGETLKVLREKINKHKIILRQTSSKLTNGKAFHFLCKYMEQIFKDLLPEKSAVF